MDRKRDARPEEGSPKINSLKSWKRSTVACCYFKQGGRKRKKQSAFQGVVLIT